jgi:tRNA(Ile)-lysidine synthase
MSLPGGLVATVDATHLRIQRGSTTPSARIEETRLAVPGVTRAGEWTIEVKAPGRVAKPGRARDEATIDAHAVHGGIVVRSRKPGDRLRPLGLGGEKKLQDIFVDAKMPREKRDGVPVIADARGIIWVAGHCIDERAAVTAATRRTLRLTAWRNRIDDGRRGALE